MEQRTEHEDRAARVNRDAILLCGRIAVGTDIERRAARDLEKTVNVNAARCSRATA